MINNNAALGALLRYNPIRESAHVAVRQFDPFPIEHQSSEVHNARAGSAICNIRRIQEHV
jgi:hypothetical protein